MIRFNYEDEALDQLSLTKKQQSVLKAVRSRGVTKEAAESIGFNFNTYRRTLETLRKKVLTPVAKVEEEKEITDMKRKLNDLSSDYKTFTEHDEYIMVVTSAQNGTRVHPTFWKNLNKLVDTREVNSKLLVIPIRYRNPTSVFDDLEHEYWDPAVMSYVCEDDFKLNSNISILGALKSQPTAVRPLSGLEQASEDRSAIIGHTKLELKCIATPSNRLPKILVSTGACTQPNYTDSKAGYKANKAHKLSAILVHVKDKRFLMWQIVADNEGNFIHMNEEFYNGTVRKAGRPNVLSTGDLHGVNHSHEAVQATKEMIQHLNPEIITYDDTLDFESGSHHAKKDPVHQVMMRKDGRNLIVNELKGTFNVWDGIIDAASADTKHVAKRANHDEHFERWVKETDPRTDPDNALVWCKAFTEMVDGRDPFKMYAKELMHNYDKVNFLVRDVSYMINGVDHAGHGDKGANGARGSLQGFTKLGCPGQWSHSHTPGVMNDQYQNGTLSVLRMGYNVGPSSWLNCNTVQYANGQRSLFFIIDGIWKF